LNNPSPPRFEHPDQDCIDAVLVHSGGYPHFVSLFEEPVTRGAHSFITTKLSVRWKGDLPNHWSGKGGSFKWHRVFTTLKPVTVVGVALEGAVIQDGDSHRLAGPDEMLYNSKASYPCYL